MQPQNIPFDEPVLAQLQEARTRRKTPDELAQEAVQTLLRHSRWQDLLVRGERYGRESGSAKEDVERVVHESREEQRNW